MSKYKPKPPNLVYDTEAYKKELLRLQESEVFHVIDHYAFTVTELIDELWDPTTVRLLREVAPYAAMGYHSEEVTYGAFRFRIQLTDQTGIAPPRSGMIRMDSPKVLEFLTDLGRIVARWHRAKNTIEKLFQDYTFAEVRYLLPPLQAIFPPDHILRKVNPKPATNPTYDQAMAVREVVQTLANGLMSNPDRPKHKFNGVGFQVFHENNWDDASPTFWVA